MLTQDQLLDIMERLEKQGMELFFPKDIQQGWMMVHNRARCVPPCAIHAPSDHPLNKNDLHWRSDLGIFERACNHGIGHPDPDDLAYKRTVLTPEQYRARALEVHGCDWCCS